jgi:hypothetical protein
MKSFSRQAHDLCSQIRSGLGFSLSVCDNLQEANPLAAFLLQEEGREKLNNSLEEAFYGASVSPAKQEWPCRKMLRIKNACLVGDQGQIFLEDGRWLNVCPSQVSFPQKKVRSPIKWGSTEISVPAFHLTGLNHENHGHFFFQHLPRLLAAQDVLMKIENLHYLIAPGHRKWQERYLGYFGVAPERILEVSPGTVRCRDLYYVPQLWGGQHLSRPEEYRKIKNTFHRPMKKEGPVLFISREDAPDRRLLNEGEVMAELESVFGPVEKLLLGRTPLAEQLEKVAKARLIIGPQGQGMTVSLFAEGSVVVILEAGERPETYSWCQAYRDAALICGNQAIRLFSQSPRDSQHNWVFPKSSLLNLLLRLRQIIM